MDIIQTDRLVLRRQTTKDAEFILNLMNDPEWIRYIGDRGVQTHEEACDYIQTGAIAMYHEHGFGLYLTELKEDRIPIGICGLVKRDSLDDVDLGFAIAREFRAKDMLRKLLPQRWNIAAMWWDWIELLLLSRQKTQNLCGFLKKLGSYLNK